MNSPSLLTSALTCYLEACAKSRLDSPVCVFQLMHPLQTGPSLAATVAFVKYLAFFSFSQKVWSNTDETYDLNLWKWYCHIDSMHCSTKQSVQPCRNVCLCCCCNWMTCCATKTRTHWLSSSLFYIVCYCRKYHLKQITPTLSALNLSEITPQVIRRC